MHLLASILDPADNGFDISDLSVLLGVILTVSVTTATIVRWNAKRVATERARERKEMERRLLDEIEARTKPIQPEYRNDGGSLRDVADKLDTVIERQSYISDRLDHHITWHLDKE